MDFPEKVIIGVLGEAGGIEARAGWVVVNRELDGLDRVAKRARVAELERMRREGGTVLLVTYDEELLAEVCDEIWWVEFDQRGDPGEVLKAYRKHAAQEIRRLGDGHRAEMAPAMRRGDGRAKVSAVELLGASGQATVVWNSGELVAVRVGVKFERPVEDPVIGMLIRTRIGLNVYGTNTELELLRFGPCAAGEEVAVTFGFRCELCPGEYTLTIASHDPDGVWHDWLEDAVAFSVTDSRYTAGVANLRARVEVVKRR